MPSLAPRSDFPALGEVAYLNAASISLVPLPVREAAREFEEDVGGRGTIGFDEAAETRALEAPREAAARLLGVRPEDVAIPTSATEALAQMAWWLRPRGNVVSIDLEFPSVTYPWLRVAEETGADVRLLEAGSDPASLSLDALARLVDERTEVVCVSHVQYATGHRFDARALAELAHAHGALLVLDATQSAGVVPVDAAACEVDVLVTASYKWLSATFGAAVCYVRPELHERFRPPFVGWRSASDPFLFDARELRLAAGARRMEASTMAYGAGVALAAAIDYLTAFGIEEILAHDLRLASLLTEGLDELGAEVVTPREDSARAGIVAARFPGRDGEEVARRLNEAGVVVSPRFGATRFSLHLYNDEGDVARALDVLAGILAARR